MSDDSVLFTGQSSEGNCDNIGALLKQSCVFTAPPTVSEFGDLGPSSFWIKLYPAVKKFLTGLLLDPKCSLDFS